jgi:hypothetical protein
MKEYTNPDAFKDAHPQLFNRLCHIYGEPFPTEPFSNTVGGSIFIIEDPSEFSNVKDAKGLSVNTPGALDFDVFEEVFIDFIEVAVMSNNTGGKVYYIPMDMATETIKSNLMLYKNL